MISIEKLKIKTTLQKLPKNVGDLGKISVAKGFQKPPKAQKIAQSGHTALGSRFTQTETFSLVPLSKGGNL